MFAAQRRSAVYATARRVPAVFEPRMRRASVRACYVCVPPCFSKSASETRRRQAAGMLRYATATGVQRSRPKVPQACFTRAGVVCQPTAPARPFPRVPRDREVEEGQVGYEARLRANSARARERQRLGIGVYARTLRSRYPQRYDAMAYRAGPEEAQLRMKEETASVSDGARILLRRCVISGALWSVTAFTKKSAAGVSS